MPEHGPVRVLVADDEPAVRVFMKIVLEDEGYVVVVAANGREALKRLSAQPVDVLITDLQMPVMTGQELFLALREQGTRVPVIFMSAGSNARAAAAACGAEAYLAKPFDLDTLLETIAQLVEPARDCRL